MKIMNGRAKKNENLILTMSLQAGNAFFTRLLQCGPLWAMVLFIAMSGSLHAQGSPPTLTCNPAPINAPKEIAVNQSCQGDILPGIIVDTLSTTYLQSNMSIALFTQAGTLIKKDTGSLTVNLNPYLGTIVRVEILVLGTAFSCNGFARIVDKMPPVINCRDTVVSCSVDTSGINLGRPTITNNNCNGTLTYQYKDSVTVSSCSSDTIQKIFRRWIVADIYGNADTCIQKISLIKPNLDSLSALRRVVFPRDTLLSCSSPNVSPNVTGFPTVNGSKINSPGICKINYTYTDDTTRTCGDLSFAVIRRWTAIDVCTSNDTLHTQIIQVKDTTKPVIVCPVPKRVSTQPSICMALVSLSAPQLITDNCDPEPSLMVTTPFSGTYPSLISMPLGTHTITYMVRDKCGNSAVCTSTVEVFDTTPPVAICKGPGNIILTNEGTAYASAVAFDSGSRDNCGLPIYYKVRRKDTNSCNGANGDDSPAPGYQEWFDDFVSFCCEDVTKGKITIEMRVYVANPGAGPVDPARETQGGNLFGNYYNTCEVKMTVEDKLPPVIICPANTSTECNDELINLGRFGSPIVLEACGYSLDSTFNITRAECNTGLLTRTFTATDARGLKASCTQSVNIVNNSVLLAQHITWPGDVTINSCNAKVGVNDLPINNRRPKVNEPLCAQIAYAYTDNVFNMTSPGCFKVYRTWEVVDLCKYVPGLPGHRFTHAQLIIVEDKTPPVLVAPPNQMVNLFTDCNVAQVTIPLATASDNCNQDLIITNNSPYATQNGANASGTYPLGTTTFTFSVSDGCGNKVSAQMSVTVIDKKPPTPVCQNLAVNLSKMPAIMAMVDAKSVNLASLDVCGGPIKLSIKRGNSGNRIPPHPLDTMLTFTCADFGLQSVELWVTDARGNSDFCTVTVDVQDNDGLCLTNPIGKIAGTIKTEKGDDVEKVLIKETNNPAMTSLTSVTGTYVLNNLPFGKNYRLQPTKNDDLLNGLSTMDLILIQKFILGIIQLKSPYQQIAADLDRSGSVTTLDLIKLRKLILGRDTDLGTLNNSWRFIDADYRFPEGVNPLKAPFPEAKTIDDFKLKYAEANFIGIKVGDLNSSATPNSLIIQNPRSTFGELQLQLPNRKFTYGEEFTVDMLGVSQEDVAGFQFTLDFDERILELVDYSAGDIPNISDENFALIDKSKGILTASWNVMREKSWPVSSSTVLKLTFRARKSSELVYAFNIAPQPTIPEAYTHNGDMLDLNLIFKDGFSQAGKGGYHLYQNYPNPFSQKTMIGFTIPQEQEVSLSVMDVAGRLVWATKGIFPKGLNEIPFQKDSFLSDGVYFYKLETSAFSDVKRMILTTNQ
jgi:hypothetical protein